MNAPRRNFIKTIATVASLPVLGSVSALGRDAGGQNKFEHIVIYRDPRFYCIEPSVLRRPDGELLLAFRRAPDRRAFGERSPGGHIDCASQLVMVRSTDNGRTWSETPELIYSHPFGGTQGGSLIQLRDGPIVINSYAWLPLRTDMIETVPPKVTTRHGGKNNFLGGYVMRSESGGHSWKGPLKPTLMPHPGAVDAFGDRISMFNRGAMCEGRNGRLYWAARSCVDVMDTRHYELHLLTSDDQGVTWERACRIAKESNISFTETSLIETPAGDLVGFVRARRLEQRVTDGSEGTLQGVPLDDHIAVVVRSTDGGKSFQWEEAGIFGFPFHALRLADGTVWLTYGYRKKPFGVRARLLNPECTNISDAPEIVLRDDGGTSDLGYPWSTLLSDGRILTIYWMNLNDGLRHIAGTIVG